MQGLKECFYCYKVNNCVEGIVATNQLAVLLNPPEQGKYNALKTEVKAVLLNPPEQGKYNALKTALLNAFGKS